MSRGRQFIGVVVDAPAGGVPSVDQLLSVRAARAAGAPQYLPSGEAQSLRGDLGDYAAVVHGERDEALARDCPVAAVAHL